MQTHKGTVSVRVRRKRDQTCIRGEGELWTGDLYQGFLRVAEGGWSYTRTAGPWRLTREDAREDAERALRDCEAVGQLP